MGLIRGRIKRKQDNTQLEEDGGGGGKPANLRRTKLIQEDELARVSPAACHSPCPFQLLFSLFIFF